MAVEDRQVVHRLVELVDGDGHHVRVDVAVGLLVEVVPDAGRVVQELFDRHRRIDHRKGVGQQAANRRFEAELARLDERHHGERGEPLHGTRDGEPRVQRDRASVGPIGVSAGQLDEALAIPRHSEHT